MQVWDTSNKVLKITLNGVMYMVYFFLHFMCNFEEVERK